MRGVASLVAWLREPIQPGLQRAFTVWCSDAVAHSLDKIIALERAALREYADLRERLQAFETRYQLSFVLEKWAMPWMLSSGVSSMRCGNPCGHAWHCLSQPRAHGASGVPR
jgi:hypothetical protein